MAQSNPAGEGPPTQGPGQRRFVDPDEVRHPKEVSDPGSFNDDSSRNWTAWIKQNWPYVFIGFPIAFGIFVLAFSQVLRTVPELMASRRVQMVLGGLLIAVTCLLYGLYHHRSVIKNLEELTLKKDDNEPGVYYGEFKPGSKKVPDRFTPLKSCGLVGQSKRPYTVEELSSALADRWVAKNPDHSRDDPAHIWLHRAFLGVKGTDLGKKVVQSTAGLEVDEYGDTAVIRATPPNQGSSKQINEYEDIISSAHSEVSHIRKKYQRAIRQMKDIREMDNIAVEDAVDQFLERHERVQHANNPYSNGNQKKKSEDGLGLSWDESDEEMPFNSND